MNKFRLLLLLMLMGIGIGVHAEAPAIENGTLTVYDGDATSQYLPVYGYYMDAFLRHQYIIPEADLVNMVDQTIYGLKYYSTKTEDVSWGNATFDVYLENVNYIEFANLAYAEKTNVVYSGKIECKVNPLTGKGEVLIIFDTPFTYSGGNLLIGIDNTVPGSYISCNFNGTATEYTSGLTGYSYSSLDAVSANARQFIPKTMLILDLNFADQEAAQAVINLINAIGTVTLESEAAIVAARNAYDALTEGQQELVTNYQVLVEAEARLAVLKDDPSWQNWFFYDDGNVSANYGRSSGSFEWGILVPAGTITDNVLTKVALYEATSNLIEDITLTVYNGGDQPEDINSLYSETFTPVQGDQFHIITLGTPVTVDPMQNIWIIFASQNSYPMTITRSTYEPGKCWVSMGEWKEILSAFTQETQATFKIRAYFETESMGVEDIQASSDGKLQKILHDGQLYILRGDKIFNATGMRVK